MTLTGNDRRTLLLALSSAISHEHDVINKLEADHGFPCINKTIHARREQIEVFENLRDKLTKTTAVEVL